MSADRESETVVGRAAPEAAESKVAVDLDLCKACGICIKLCPEGVFLPADGARQSSRHAERIPWVAREKERLERGELATPEADIPSV